MQYFKGGRSGENHFFGKMLLVNCWVMKCQIFGDVNLNYLKMAHRVSQEDSLFMNYYTLISCKSWTNNLFKAFKARKNYVVVQQRQKDQTREKFELLMIFIIWMHFNSDRDGLSMVWNYLHKNQIKSWCALSKKNKNTWRGFSLTKLIGRYELPISISL